MKTIKLIKGDSICSALPEQVSIMKESGWKVFVEGQESPKVLTVKEKIAAKKLADEEEKALADAEALKLASEGEGK